MFSSIWSMTLRISAWNAGHKPPSWKKAGRQPVLLGSLLPVLGAARLPAPTINVSPHRSCPASTLFTISLLGASVYTCRRGSRNSDRGQKKIKEFLLNVLKNTTRRKKTQCILNRQ